MAYKKPQIPNLRAAFKAVAKTVPPAVEKAVDAWMEEQRLDFIDRIQKQRFVSFRVILYPESGTNLSPRWLAVKAAYGADLRTMIATGHYVSQIKLWKSGKGRDRRYRIGFHANTKARDLNGHVVDFPLWRVARVQEFGSDAAQIPPRPHWRPYANLMRRRAPAARRACAHAAGVALVKAAPKFIVEAPS